MKLNRRSLLMLIVLMSIGLLLGGAIHSSLHADEHGDCHVCHLAIADLIEDGPRVGTPIEFISAPVPVPESVILLAPRSAEEPRGPPA